MFVHLLFYFLVNEDWEEIKPMLSYGIETISHGGMALSPPQEQCVIRDL